MHRPIRSTLLALTACATFQSLARADFLDGRCVDSQGTGIPNVDITAEDWTTGNSVSVTNGGTDASGFFHATIPAGTFRIIFRPPQPPASTSLYTEIGPIAVSGTANVGNVALNQGFSISGTVRNPANVGVAGVNLDVVILSTGASARLLYDDTDATGSFSFASPGGPIELRFDTTPVVGQTLAPQAIQLDLTANTNLGFVNLAQGYLLSAIVRNPSNQAVADCDLDVAVASTGVKLYTPNDNTNGSGVASVIVPAGTFTVDFCPPFNLHLASGRVGPVSVSANTSLGVVTLANGFVLSGNVRNSLNQPVANVAVNPKQAGTGTDIPLCDNHTDANGDYATILPVGTFDVYFIPPQSQQLGAAASPGFVFSGNASLNAILPPAFTPFCAGDGSLSTPCPCGNTGAAGRGCRNSSAGNMGALLTATGTTHPDTVVLTTTGELPTALSIFLQGNTPISAGTTYGDGVRCTGGVLKRIAAKAASGGTVSYPGPGEPSISDRSAALNHVIPIAATRYYQTYYRDNNQTFCVAPTGSTFNISSGVQVVW